MIRTSFFVSAAIVALMIGVSVYGWMTIDPDAMIARHWSISGEADGFSPRNHILIGLPLLGVLLTAVFMAVPFIDPRKDNIMKSSRLYVVAWLGSLAVAAVAHGSIVVGAAQGGAPNVDIIIMAVGVMLAVKGNYMAKSRSSWFIGLRTPWSLTSEHAWVAANRTAGWLLTLTGLATIAAIWFRDLPEAVAVMVSGVAAAVILGVVVSYVAWRGDPERIR